MISVSKLCCPVCWTILGILNEDEPLLSFPGCHSTIYPVELPTWLPSHIEDEITKRFRELLRRELEIMVRGDEERKRGEEERKRRHTRGHASHESESNISVASTSRDDGREGIEFEEYESVAAETQH